MNVEVSCFANYTTPDNPRPVNLLTWLTSDKYGPEVEAIRLIDNKTERDTLKAKLPAITPSGLFNYRQGTALIRHSGLLQFDIDWKENRHIGNYGDLKKHLSNIPNIAYCGLSVSGKGFWGLVPIEHPDKHQYHFDSLQNDFRWLGIELDPKPRNVASLRGYAFDPDGYFNHQATVYYRYREPAQLEQPIRVFNSQDSGGDAGRVEQCISEIVSRKIDLTSCYEEWFEIGCSLANAFGEAGREYFQQVSQFHPEYSETKTDRQFSECLKHQYPFFIGTFFYHCQQAGISYTNEAPLPPAPRPETATPESVALRKLTRTFYEFTRQDPAFRWLGLASLHPRSD